MNMRPVKVGNAAIDGEVIGQGWKMALEINSTKDDIIRGIGQCTEALARGYQSAALVTSVQHSRRIRSDVFLTALSCWVSMPEVEFSKCIHDVVQDLFDCSHQKRVEYQM